jgi:hypothetical protein
MKSTKKASQSKEFTRIKETLAEIDEQILLADGFEEALIGYVEIFNKTIALYDRDKCLDILMKRDGMDYDSAVEFFEFNTTGAYVGEHTPAFATILRNEEKPPKKKV